MAMEALGRMFNVGTTATTAKTYFNVTACAAVEIILIGATSGNATVYIAEDNAATGEVAYTGADSAHGDGLTYYWTQASGLWTKHTQAVASTFTAATGGLAVCWVPMTGLPAAYTHITASHASGSFLIVPHDLTVQRGPANLAALTS